MVRDQILKIKSIYKYNKKNIKLITIHNTNN